MPDAGMDSITFDGTGTLWRSGSDSASRQNIGSTSD